MSKEKQKVNWYRTEKYAWECPDCGYFNVDDDDPTYEDTVCCMGCCEDFPVGKEE